MATPMMAPPPLQPGQQPTPEQIQQMQRQLAEEAAKRGLTVPQYVEQLKQQAMRQHQMQQQALAQQQAQQQQQAQIQQAQMQQQQQAPINNGPPKPEAIAVADFLRSQELKPRTCILHEKRKDMFKVKRAMRALQSPAYEKARAKNKLLPPVTDRESAENVFKLLPLSMLALRVSKIDPHEGHKHAKKKRVKGLWTVKIEQQQEAQDQMYYVWLYEGSQWKQKFYGISALVLVLAVAMFPLWPLVMRQGVWYLSMGMLGLLGLFFAMAVFRLILFCVTVLVMPRGLWLYPNLFEDVGFFDSFRPVWGWQEDKKAKKSKKSKAAANGSAESTADVRSSGTDPDISAPLNIAATTSSEPAEGGAVQQRKMQASVEEAEDE